MTARSWGAEAALRMLHNNLDPEVAERPDDLVVYGGTGKAARDWPSYHALVRTLTLASSAPRRSGDPWAPTGSVTSRAVCNTPRRLNPLIMRSA